MERIGSNPKGPDLTSKAPGTVLEQQAAKGTATVRSEWTPVFKDADTGLNTINPVVSNNRGRIQGLGLDPDKGKFVLHESQVVVQLEKSLSGP